MSDFPRSFLKRGVALVFGSNGFSGGRLNNLDGNGVVEIELSIDAERRELDISLFDNMSSEDGHYSPVSLSLDQAMLLHEWLDYQIRAMNSALPATRPTK
jgi:hypothetical protein